MTEHKEIEVGLANFPPLVSQEGDTYKGFEIDLWEEVCSQLGYTPRYSMYEFKDLLPALQAGEVRVAVAGITRTEDRERAFDFSHRTLDSDLCIMVPNQKASTIVTAFSAFFSKDMLKIFGMLIAFIVVTAHLIWFAERNGGGSLSGAYIPSIFEAVWWGVVTVSTVGYGDFFPVTWLGRFLGVIIILSGLAVFGLYIGQISSSLTVERLKSKLYRKEDLKDKRVATLQKTQAVDELRHLGARVFEAPRLDDAYRALDDKEVDAVVFDTPVIMNHIKGNVSHTHAVVGERFRKQTYGFAFRENDSLREDVNRALLHFRENGIYDRIYARWF